MSPTFNQKPPCPINHITEFHIYLFFQHFRNGGYNFLGKPVMQNLKIPSHNLRPFPLVQSPKLERTTGIFMEISYINM